MSHDHAVREESPFDVPEARALIERLCILQSEVMNDVIGYEHAGDCFCGGARTGRGYWQLGMADHFRNEGLAVDYIERVVRAAIKSPDGLTIANVLAFEAGMREAKSRVEWNVRVALDTLELEGREIDSPLALRILEAINHEGEMPRPSKSADTTPGGTP